MAMFLNQEAPSAPTAGRGSPKSPLAGSERAPRQSALLGGGGGTARDAMGAAQMAADEALAFRLQQDEDEAARRQRVRQRYGQRAGRRRRLAAAAEAP